MITEKTFTEEWMSKFFGDNTRKNQVIEKVIYALYLLEELSLSEVDFIFKGGTSLMLKTQEFKRFSIDIDIVLEESNLKNLETFVLNNKFKMFSQVEEDPRNNSKIKKKHYKFYYESITKERNPYVLLDIVFEEITYENYEETPIQFLLLDLDENITITTTPIMDELLGDKLTAFAPNTIGILYSKRRHSEIIKQLFDVSTIYNKIGINNTTILIYYKMAAHELVIRELNDTVEDCIKDSLETIKCILSNGHYGDNDEFHYLKSGISGFGNYVDTRFNINHAYSIAADAYIMYVQLLAGSVEAYKEILRPSSQIDVSTTYLKRNHRFLSRHLKNYDEVLKAIIVENKLQQ